VTVPEALARLVSYRLRQVQIAAVKTFEARLQGHGAAPRYFGLLKLVEANPGIAQARLAEAVFLDRSSLVPILDTLTREGWLERRATSRDRRLRRVFLTAEGAARLPLLSHAVAAHEARLTEGLSAADLETLHALLARLDGNLRWLQADGPDRPAPCAAPLEGPGPRHQPGAAGAQTPPGGAERPGRGPQEEDSR
jgi:DNA-binding MarR family transcriptional regulator